MLRDILQPSGLFIEGTETYSQNLPVNTYYGFNVTKTEREPVDQIHGFIAARRIQERNAVLGEPGMFYPFVAGIFEILNATSREEIGRVVEINGAKEQHKKVLFESILARFRLSGDVFLTHDLWGNPDYWEVLSEVLSSPRFSYSNLRQDTLKWYAKPEMLDQVCSVAEVAPGLMALPDKLINRIGKWPAAILYTPIEVAEAMFFARFKRVRCKIGHMDETVYDKYIIPFIDVIHLRQPIDLKSTQFKARGVTPYIDKERPRDPKIRVFFDDVPETLQDRLAHCSIEEYVYTLTPEVGEVLNPILDKCVLAVESARAMGRTPIDVCAVTVESGMDLIRAVYAKKVRIAELAQVMPEFVYSYLIAPFSQIDPAVRGGLDESS